MKRTRSIIIAATLAAASLVLAACGSEAGAAAVIGNERITEVQLAEQVDEVLQAQGKPTNTVDEALVAGTLDRMIKARLVSILAGEAGVQVPQGQVDLQLQAYDEQVGGRAEVEKIFLESGVAPSQVEGVVRLNLEAELLGQLLAPGQSADEQGGRVVEAIAVFADQLGVEVSPRYGTWSPQTIGVGAVPDDLSVPAGA